VNKKRIRRLFARLNAVYGGTWSARYTTQSMFDLAVEEWASDLAPYSDGEIEEAYKLCKQRYTTAPTARWRRTFHRPTHGRRPTSRKRRNVIGFDRDQDERGQP